MKKGYIRLLIVCSLLISFLTLNGLRILLNPYALIFIISIATLGIHHYLGYEKDNHRYKKDVILDILIYSISYIAITNLFGLFIGFYQTQYGLSILTILKNIVPIIFMIILSEMIRYMIITKGSGYRIVQILTLVIFVLLDITLLIGDYKEIINDCVKYIIVIILPSMSTNIMLTYLTSKVGYRPTILYRALFELPTYILPIFPNFGLYTGSIIRVMSPIILMCIMHYNFSKLIFKQDFSRKKLNTGRIAFIITSIILLIMFALTSGWFKYYAIIIGSGSMRPTIREGDVVIIKKLNDKEIADLKEGEILIFNYAEKMIIHRIVRIVKFKDTYYFYTKGDNNESEDGYPIEIKDIIGTSFVKIPYVGYPTLWLNKMIK